VLGFVCMTDLQKGYGSRGAGSVGPLRRNRYKSYSGCCVRGCFRGHTHERSRSHREAQHSKLRPSTQQRDIVPYQSTLSGENKASREALGTVVVRYMEQIDGSQISAET